MFFVCNAPLIAYLLLSCFEIITEKERDVVRFVLDLISSYDISTGELPMTHNVYLLAQIYQAELRVLATLHHPIHEGPLEDDIQGGDLLSAVILPLIQRATRSEHEAILQSMSEAEQLLARPLETLNELAVTWKSRNHEPALSWPKSEPHPEHTKPYRNSYSSTSTKNVPRSECSKELELLASSYPKKSKSRSRSKSFRFSFPHLAIGGRIISFNSDCPMEYDRSSNAAPHSIIDEAFEKELQELVEHAPEVHCLCHTGHICFIHAEGHPSDYETQFNTPSRRKLARSLRSGFKRLLTSRSI